MGSVGMDEWNSLIDKAETNISIGGYTVDLRRGAAVLDRPSYDEQAFLAALKKAAPKALSDASHISLLMLLASK